MGAGCRFGGIGATGYDGCKQSSVCSAYATPGTDGVRERICDLQGATATCGASGACVAKPDLFSAAAAAGVCEPAPTP